MSTGLLALLDDVAAIAKMAASSLDDVAAQTAKAGTKAVGVVIDDAAVTPRYVVGMTPKRELPIIAKIAAGSLRNKLLVLLPAALLLGLVAPWTITPLLMAGGVYLCYEGAEKLFEVFWPHKPQNGEHGLHGKQQLGPDDIERNTVSGAVRTDFILSAEIMAITLAAVPETGFWTQAIVLASVGVGITLAVYGVVALIVKADDFGVALVRNSPSLGAFGKPVRACGRALVVGTPVFLKLLATIGTAAMLWVGGSIVVHGLEHHGLSGPADAIEHLAELAAHAVPAVTGMVSWLASVALLGVVGLAVGAVSIPLAGKGLVPAYRWVRTAFPNG